MHSFKIRPDGYKEIRKKMLLWSIPSVVIGLFIGSLSGWINSDDRYKSVKPEYVTDNSGSSPDYLMYLPFVVFCGVITFGIYRALKRIKNVYDSYELQISDNVIAREQLNTPAISIYLKDVQEIIKKKNGSFLIRGPKATDLIIVPKYIEHPEQLTTVLEQIKPLVSKGKGTTQLNLQALLGLVSLGLLICVNVSFNKPIIAIAGTLFIAITIYNFIQTQRSKNVDYRTKRIRWVSMLALLLVIIVMYTKLTGSPLFLAY